MPHVKCSKIMANMDTIFTDCKINKSQMNIANIYIYIYIYIYSFLMRVLHGVTFLCQKGHLRGL